MKKKITCKTGLRKNIISKAVFDREIALCKTLSEKKKGCGWGKCKSCGVVLLLWKLRKGILIEDKKEITTLKKSILRQ